MINIYVRTVRTVVSKVYGYFTLSDWMKLTTHFVLRLILPRKNNLWNNEETISENKSKQKTAHTTRK